MLNFVLFVFILFMLKELYVTSTKRQKMGAFPVRL
jgi:hypothetical protein